MLDLLEELDLKVPDGVDVTAAPPRTAADRINAAEGELNLSDGIDCPICKNKGYIAEGSDPWVFTIRDCECKAKRRSVAIAKASGLSELFQRSDFKSFQTPDEWTRLLKQAAGDYLKSEAGKWLYISGEPGTGKTHICVAVCRRLIGEGNMTRIMKWREDAPALKAAINEEDYAARFREFADVPVLYIDDFFKGTVTDADVNLAFSLINARYNKRTRTILSTELPLSEIARIDEAIGSRIYERARGFIFKAPQGAKNWRKDGEGRRDNDR